MKSVIRYSHDRLFRRIIPTYLKKSRSILDVGCGKKKKYKELFSNKLYETRDVDKKATTTYCMDIQKERPNKKYDLILALQVFEHIPNIRATVKNISKLLKKEGIFIGSVPLVYPIHGEEDYFRYTNKGLEYLLSFSFNNLKILPYGNRFLSVAILCSGVPFIGPFFNHLAKPIETLFQKPNKKHPSGYFFICSNIK